MRELSGIELSAVAGGEMESNESPYDVQVAGLAKEAGKVILSGVLWDTLKSLYNDTQVPNPPANETDNGGSSYGLGNCSTFGCS